MFRSLLIALTTVALVSGTYAALLAGSDSTVRPEAATGVQQGIGVTAAQAAAFDSAESLEVQGQS